MASIAFSDSFTCASDSCLKSKKVLWVTSVSYKARLSSHKKAKCLSEVEVAKPNLLAPKKGLKMLSGTPLCYGDGTYHFSSRYSAQLWGPCTFFYVATRLKVTFCLEINIHFMSFICFAGSKRKGLGFMIIN